MYHIKHRTQMAVGTRPDKCISKKLQIRDPNGFPPNPYKL